jgi:hypothetical protein
MPVNKSIITKMGNNLFCMENKIVLETKLRNQKHISKNG